MKINYRVKGADRKPLINAISRELDALAQYKGAPTFEYEVGEYSIDKIGMVTGPDNRGLVIDLLEIYNIKAVSEEYDTTSRDSEEQPGFEELRLSGNEELGLGRERYDPMGENRMQESDVLEPEGRAYRAELSDPDWPDRMEVFGAEGDADAVRQAYEYASGEVILLELHELDEDYNEISSVDITRDTQRLVIEMPLDGFTPEKLDNLSKLVNAKAPLLKAALGADELSIKHTGVTLQFPWFANGLDADTVEAYAMLVSRICAAAKTKTRVTAKARDTGSNPKYAMRCWLLSLGFIGDEYKNARKILISNLDGNSSWRGGHAPLKTPAQEDAQ